MFQERGGEKVGCSRRERVFQERKNRKLRGKSRMFQERVAA